MVELELVEKWEDKEETELETKKKRTSKWKKYGRPYTQEEQTLILSKVLMVVI